MDNEYAQIGLTAANSHRCAAIRCWHSALCALMLSLAAPLFTLHAQISIAYPEQAQNIVTCNQDGSLRVRASFISAGNSGQVSVNLPPGVSYVPGSLSALPGPLSIAEDDLSNPNQPRFTISPASIPAGSSIDFTISRQAGCNAREFAVSGGLFKDTLLVQTNQLSVTEDNPNLNAYNLLSASLSHQYPNGPGSQDTIISNVPQAINRPVQLTQGGLGFLTSLAYFVTVSGEIADYQLKYNNTVIPVAAVSGDTLFYELDEDELPGLFGGDGRLSNGEVILFEESFEVLACSQTDNIVKHHAFWGCGGDICQRTLPATGSVSVIVSQPEIEAGPLFQRQLPTCLDGQTAEAFGYYIENIGTSTAKIGFQLGFEGNTGEPVFGDYSATAAALDTASVRIWLDGVKVEQATLNVFRDINSCASAPTGNFVTSARYPGFTLQPGQRLEIRGEYVYCCRETCNFDYSWSTPIARFEVRDACGQNPRLELASHDFANARVGSTPVIISGPATVFEEQPAEFCFQFPELDGYPDVAGDNTYILEVGFPNVDGFNTTGQASAVDQNGNSLPLAASAPGPGTFRLELQQADYPGGAVEFCVEVDWQCGISGLFDIPVTLSQEVSPSCASACNLNITCNAFPLLLACPGEDCEGGGFVAFSQTRRVNVGLADPDNTRQWQTNEPADPGLVRLDRAAPCDTLRTEASLVVREGGLNSWPQARFRQRMLFPFFRSVKGRAEIYDDGTLAGIVDGIPATSTTQGDSIYYFDLSPQYLNSIDPDFPAGMAYEPGDSIVIKTWYYFDPQLSEGVLYDYGLSGFGPNTSRCLENQDIFNSFELSSNNFSSIASCGTTIDRVQLIAVGLTFASGGSSSFIGCRDLAWEVFTRTQRGCVIGNEIDFFPNEFRPVFRFDTVAFAKIPGFTFSRLEYRRSPGNFLLDIPPLAEDADSVYFDFSGLYSDQGGPIPWLEENARDEILKSYWQPSCASPPGQVNGVATLKYEDFNCGNIYNRKQERQLSYTPSGQFSFVLNPLVGNAFSETTCYTLSVTNTGAASGFTVPYTWLEIIDPNGDIEVRSVRKPGDEPVDAAPSGIYPLGEHKNNLTEQFEICIAQNSCQRDSFQLVFGWDCEGYPANGNTANCTLDTLKLQINPQLAEVQLQIIDQPTPAEELELCTTDTIELLVNSAQQADLLHPSLDLILPAGIELNAMVAGYPNNSDITFEPLTPTIVGDTATYDLTQHSRILGDSLPGAFSNPDIANRQIRMIFEIETGCGFNPLQSVAFYRAYGESPCREPAIGANAVVASNPIQVEGTEAPYEALLAAQLQEPLQGCGAASTVSAVFTMTGGSNTERDTAELLLPEGITYLPGSLDCNGPLCPQYTGTLQDMNGQNIIRFAMPNGLSEGDSIDFRFDIQNNSAACTDGSTALFRTLATRAPLICNGVPCTNEIAVETSRDTLTLRIEKARLSLQEGYELCSSDDGSFELQGAISLSGPPLAEADTVLLQLFCADAEGGISDQLLATTALTALPAADAAAEFALSGTSCPDTTGYWLRISAGCACPQPPVFVPYQPPIPPACPPRKEICINQPGFKFFGAFPEGGTYTGPGTISNVFDPLSAGVGLHIVTYTYTNSQGCTNSCDFEVNVRPVPIVSCPEPLEVLLSDPPTALDEALPAGGTYNGPGVTDGVFDPQLSGTGNWILTYTYADSAGCTNSCAFEVSVSALNTRLGDRVWLDDNRNGLQDTGESGLPGIPVVLYRLEGPNQMPVDTVYTDQDGLYAFFVQPGQYSLQFLAPAGLDFTDANQGSDDAIDSDAKSPEGRTGIYTLLPDQAINSIDAGLYSICNNVTDPGQIGNDQVLCGPGNIPAPLLSMSDPEGGNGELEYLWMKSSVPGPFNMQTWELIPGATGPEYAPGPVQQTTYYARCARREFCNTFLESNIVTVEVGNDATAKITGPDIICVGETYIYEAGPADSWSWSMSPGLSPTSADGPSVAVSAPNSHGAFQITLEVTENGCTSTVTKKVTATRSPIFCEDILPLQAGLDKSSTERQIKVSWMMEEFFEGFDFQIEFAPQEGKGFQPVGRVQQPNEFIGGQQYFEFSHQPDIWKQPCYRLRVTTPDGRQFYSSVAEVSLEEMIRVYPNPSPDLVNVEWCSGPTQEWELELYKANGQFIRRMQLPEGSWRAVVDMRDLPKGTYFVKLLQNVNLFTIRPVVKK